MESERSSSTSKALHNFIMPCGLRWGSQRILMCVKVNSNGEISAVGRRPSALSISNTRVVSNDNVNSAVSSETPNVSIRPWNLRKRKAASKAPMVNDFIYGSASSTRGTNSTTSASKGLMVDVMKPNSSLLSARPRSGVDIAVTTSCDKKDRSRFSVPLKWREIEEDLLAFTGRKPSCRPKKRSKNVQKQLDTLFPGLWLTEATADMYKDHERR